MRGKSSGPSIKELTSTVFDNGRRGEPRPGCDCLQCFGYCLVDAEQALRDQALKNDAAYKPRDDFKLDLVS